MSQKYRRYTLKPKEAKRVLEQATQRLKVDLEKVVPPKATVEVVVADFGEIFLIAEKPLLFKVGEDVLPTLFFTELAAHLPKIVVDMGAVPYVCKGADVMAPGIRRIEGEFQKGDIAVVVDEKHGKTLALGEAVQDSSTARNAKQGPVIKNYHFVSDDLWNFAKTFAAGP